MRSQPKKRQVVVRRRHQAVLRAQDSLGVRACPSGHRQRLQHKTAFLGRKRACVVVQAEDCRNVKLVH